MSVPRWQRRIAIEVLSDGKAMIDPLGISIAIVTAMFVFVGLPLLIAFSMGDATLAQE